MKIYAHIFKEFKMVKEIENENELRRQVANDVRQEDYIDQVIFIETKLSRGVPDLEILTKDGEIFKIELKYKKGTISELQRHYFWTAKATCILTYVGLDDFNRSIYNLRYKLTTKEGSNKEAREEWHIFWSDVLKILKQLINKEI